MERRDKGRTLSRSLLCILCLCWWLFRFRPNGNASVSTCGTLQLSVDDCPRTFLGMISPSIESTISNNVNAANMNMLPNVIIRGNNIMVGGEMMLVWNLAQTRVVVSCQLSGITGALTKNGTIVFGVHSVLKILHLSSGKYHLTLYGTGPRDLRTTSEPRPSRDLVLNYGIIHTIRIGGLCYFFPGRNQSKVRILWSSVIRKIR